MSYFRSYYSAKAVKVSEISGSLNLPHIRGAIRPPQPENPLPLGPLTLDDGASRVVGGSGVAPAIRGRIFEPFFTARPGGTGLGLAVVRTVVEAHDGRIALTDSRLGGACFQLTLPRQSYPQFLPSGHSASVAEERRVAGSLRR